jgi:hypothetical protein
MAQRLGEMLLHGGALTEAQLEEVLSAQSVYGGRIGTNLVEMGLLSEEDLAQLLNLKLGVPAVDPSSLEAVPAALVALLPQEMVLRFQVLPVALDGKRLTLAMADPSDFNAIDEIGFYTGMVVVPRVCSELRLSMALERYYGIKRVLHFIPVEGGKRTRMNSMSRINAGLEPDTGSSALATAVEPAPGTESPPVVPVSNAGAGPVTSDAICAPRPRIESVARSFAAASGEAEVVTTLMSYLREEFSRAGFLSLRRDAAVGVQAVAGGRVVPSFSGWSVELVGCTLLKRVLKERSPYLGALPETGTEAQILEKIGGTPGAAALLLPLVISEVSVAFIVVQDENGKLASGLLDLQRVVAKAGLAFEMIGIRKRIVQV